MLTEVTATRGLEIKQEGVIDVTFEVLAFANLAIFSLGFFVGFLEVVVLNKLFKNEKQILRILYKLGLYVFFFLLAIVITYPIASALEKDVSIFSNENLDRFYIFLGSITFFNALFQLSISLLVSLLYAAVSENIGQSVLIDIFTGRYFKPEMEKRIFMFLDMKSSTTIAEKLGSLRYFELLKEYYEVFSDSIIKNRGEVYQYIGDEIVISWKYEKGISNSNCLNCYFDMKKAMAEKSDMFEARFGITPDFKAGIHLGLVTTGEIGVLKKEIIFTGDVLNTTSRIQSKCNDLGKDLLVSEELYSALPHKNELEFLSEVELKGKEQKIKLYSHEKK